MKNTNILILMTLMLMALILTSCILNDDEYDDAREYEEELYIDPVNNYPYLDETLKIQLRELDRLWKKFDDEKNQNADPTGDFHNSEYIAALKDFLSQKESLAVSGNGLRWILEQNGFNAIDKTMVLSNGKEYSIRLISYNVNYYVQAITDFVGLQNNWIFMQCWSDDEFFFTIVSDGDIHTAHDFYIVDIDGITHIILTGTSSPAYPQPPFLWAWHLEEDGFTQSEIFNFSTVETDKYYVYDSVDFHDNRCLFKWTFQTDGSFLTVERDEDNDWPGLLIVNCDVDNEGRVFEFTSWNNISEIEPGIMLSLKNGRFVIE